MADITILCNDVICYICTFLDAASQIAFYLSTGNPAITDQLAKKIQTTADTPQLIYSVAMLPPHYHSILARALGGSIPFNYKNDSLGVWDLLIDHEQLFGVRGAMSRAKRNHKKYGTLRNHPAAREFIENIVIEGVVHDKMICLDEFIQFAFDIDLGMKPHRHYTPNCFRNPTERLDTIIAKSISTPYPADHEWSDSPTGWLYLYTCFYNQHRTTTYRTQKKGQEKEEQERLNTAIKCLTDNLLQKGTPGEIETFYWATKQTAKTNA